MHITRGGGGVVTFYTWHSTDVRAEWSSFSALPSIYYPPFSTKIYMIGPIFLGWYIKRPQFSDVYWYMHIFFVQSFFEAVSNEYPQSMF